MSEPMTSTPGFAPVPGAKRPPGPHTLSPLGSAYALGRDPMRFALEMWHRYGDVVRFLFWPAYALYHPDQVKRVLQENYRNYNKNFGNAFAILEAQLVLATVAQRYSLRLVPGHPVELQVLPTLRPRHGLPMTLHPRLRCGARNTWR